MSSAKTPSEQATKYLGMAWYKFLTSCGLIAGAIFDFLCCLLFLSSIFFSIASKEVHTEQIYIYLFYSLFLFGWAILTIILRNKLANFEPGTMKYVYICYGFAISVSVCSLIIALFAEQPFFNVTNISMLINLISAFLHIRYFKKRAHLFVGKTETSDDLVQELPSASFVSNTFAKPANISEINSNDILFCENCGAKLMADSAFCHKCGKKIR